MADLEVRLYGEHIGNLRRQGAGSVFDATDAWRFHRYHPLLGLSWLQDPSPRRASVGLPVWFDALLPDRGSPLRARLAASAGVREDDGFALLEVQGSDLPGAVSITGAEGDGDAPWSAEAPPPTPAGPLHFSLGGQQLKFSLTLRGEKLALPMRGEQGAYIAKIPSEQMPSLPAIEHRTLDWAERCGHEVPAHEIREIRTLDRLATLERFPGETCLVLRRYDRTAAGPVHQEDLCQVFSVPPLDRYAEHRRHRLDYADLVIFVRDACGDEAALEFTRRIAFCLASGNTDAHLQNWSILLPRDGSYRLAPAYDQVSVIALPQWGWDRDGGPSLALPLGGVRRMAEMDLAVIERFAQLARDPGLVRVFLGACRRAREVWHEIEAVAVRPHRDAIAAQWRAVPLLASL